MIAIPRAKTTLALLIIYLLAALLWLGRPFLSFEPGPRYKGLPVSYWRRALQLSVQKTVAKDGTVLYSEYRVPAFLPVRLQDLIGKAGRPAILRGDAPALPIVLLLLKDENEDVRWLAGVSLARICKNSEAERIAPQLWKTLNDQDEDLRVRKAALEALLDIDGEAASRFIFARGQDLWWKVFRDHAPGVIRAAN
jgi:hypothetical protein